MEEFNLITPTLLFSAVSLIMLAYTNRFLSYGQLVRSLKDKYAGGEAKFQITKAQIDNLTKRVAITRNMQLFGVGSLLFSMISMFLTFTGYKIAAIWVFGSSLMLFIVSLSLSVWEIMLSTDALNIYLKDFREQE